MIETYIAYAKHIEANDFVIKWVEKTLKSYLKDNKPSTEDVEHIIDYLSQEEGKISRMSYEDAHKNAEKWTKSQQKKGSNIEETEKDTKVILDFKDGFKIVQLIGENAYKREGFLMSHCVGGYHGNGKVIYSLRDKDNMPHCTIEKDQQIKGKGNGDITLKYVDYIVKFLEHTGMQVRDSEMSHLGYEVAKFSKYCTTKCYKDRYVLKGTKLEYKSGYIILKSKQELDSYKGSDLVLFDGDLIIS